MIWRCDLQPQAEVYLPRLLELTREVLASGRYCLAGRLAAFEKEFADYLGIAHCVGVANGTDAITLGLRALDVRSGDEVITTPFTAIPTVSAIVDAGARPVFVDIDAETFLLDVARVPAAVTPRTKAVVPVHLFAQMVDVDALRRRLPRPLPILEDAAQAHGCRYRGRMAGTLGELAAFSFYPTKNLGACGDGGAVVTARDDLATQLRLLRNYGKETPDHIILDGVNSRLDELQAAYLSAKLPDLEAMNTRRRELAAAYADRLAGLPVVVPRIDPAALPNFHVYVIKAPERRDALRDFLRKREIQTDVFYPFPHHLHPAYRSLGYAESDFPKARQVGREVLAMPLYPEMKLEVLERICDSVRDFFEGGRT